MKTEPETPKAGFVGFGEINTPRNFIDNRCEQAADELSAEGIELVKTSPVSDDPDGAQAARAVAELSEKDFDVLVLCVAGWIPTWAVMAVADKFRHKPVLLWGLSGWKDGDRFITTADQAGTTALRFTLEEMGYNFKYLVNYMGGKSRIAEAASFIKAASTAAKLRGQKIGLGGYRDMQLYGTAYDPMTLKGKFGIDVEHFELLELKMLMDKVSEKDIAAAADEAKNNWNFVREPQPGTLENSARLYLAFREKISERNFAGLSYNDVDGIKKLLGFAPAGALTLLHDNLSISTVPENDALGAVTQLITKALTGQVGAYLEFYEFSKNSALMGVPDYVPAEIVDGKVTVMPNSFGDFGEGILNVSKLKTGKVTLARLGYSAGKYFMHLALANACTPPKWEEAGWAPPAPQLPSLEMKFDFPVEKFIQKVLCQHYIISYGDNTKLLSEFCHITGLKIYCDN